MLVATVLTFDIEPAVVFTFAIDPAVVLTFPIDPATMPMLSSVTVMVLPYHYHELCNSILTN